MPEDNKKLAESIRNGSYYGQARGWFQAVYVSPVAERSFFLIIACLSSLVALFSVISVILLMPLIKHEAILIPAPERYDDLQVSLTELAGKHQPVNPALTRFFVIQYVTARESFSAADFLANAKFVQGQSDEATYSAYAQSYNPRNPESPFAPLTDGGSRRISLDSVRIFSNNGTMSALVNFTVTTTFDQQETNSRWTAKLNYLYTQIVPELVTNEGKKELHVNDPQFQVVHYELVPRP